MRNGEGDQMLILFDESGVCINGFVSRFKEIQVDKKLPKAFHEFMFEEPIRSIGITFCIWTKNDVWNAQMELKNESEELLQILDGNPSNYKNWAEGYYQEEFKDRTLDLSLVNKIYSGTVITKELALKINPNLEDFEQLLSDLEQIGYE